MNQTANALLPVKEYLQPLVRGEESTAMNGEIVFASIAGAWAVSPANDYLDVGGSLTASDIFCSVQRTYSMDS